MYLKSLYPLWIWSVWYYRGCIDFMWKHQVSYSVKYSNFLTGRYSTIFIRSELILHIQILPDQLRRSQVTEVPLGLLQVGVPLRVIWGYFAAAACGIAPFTVLSIRVPHILWSSLNRWELWGFSWSVSKGNTTHACLYILMLAPRAWHALHLLHLYCVQLCARFSISIHNVNMPANFVMIIVWYPKRYSNLQ